MTVSLCDQTKNNSANLALQYATTCMQTLRPLLKRLSGRRKISTKRLLKSIRENSVNSIRTVCMVRGGSEGYGIVREGSGHFLTTLYSA